MNRIVIHRLGEIVNKYRPAVPEFLEGSTRKTKKSVGQGQGKKKKKKSGGVMDTANALKKEVIAKVIEGD